VVQRRAAGAAAVGVGNRWLHMRRCSVRDKRYGGARCRCAVQPALQWLKCYDTLQ